MTTLQEAIELGQGIERPFRCPDPEHDDKNASASVNVLKGVWFCYACNARGAVDAKKAPSLDLLAQMMEPEKTCRIYPESYLDTFGYPGYWLSRFPDWLCWYAGLGEDPVTGHGTFPVRTPEGRLAGIGRRITDAEVAKAKEEDGNPSRYKYPYRWSASRTLGRTLSSGGNLLVLVEGYADAVALAEQGIPAACVYGSALHYPQVEFVLRAKPKLVILGMDSDPAGEKGAAQSMQSLSRFTGDIARVTWPMKDPGECSKLQRLQTVRGVVGDEYLEDWMKAVANMRAAFQRHIEETAA